MLTCLGIAEVRQHEADDDEAEVEAVGAAWGHGFESERW